MFEQIVRAAADYEVALEPDENTPEWWAGAPSVVRAEDGTFYLAARMREGNSPKGKRGYEVRILKSEDGRRFETVNRITREDAGVAGFERPALVIDPTTGKYKLYGCAGFDDGWSILKFCDAEDPSKFDPKSSRKALRAEHFNDGFARVAGYKDPFVIWTGGQWHMFVIETDRVERIFHFASDDGEQWAEVEGNPVMENSGWHNFYTRPACVLPMAMGYLFVYEGSKLGWCDPTYNIATGLAYSLDLKSFVDLTPTEPLLMSTTPGDYHTWRYSHWMSVGNYIYAYFEAARPNNTNEIRLTVFRKADAPPTTLPSDRGGKSGGLTDFVA